VHPRDFGRRRPTDWRDPDPSWGPRQLAQLEAAQRQHEIAFGVVERYLPSSEIRTIARLADELDMTYDRLQRLLNGRIVMQFEDVSRLRAVVGNDIDSWMTGTHPEGQNEGLDAPSK
jgi:hypothetical protein